VPGFRVSAVVHMPYGAHPSGCLGYYDFDYAFQAATMTRINRSREDWQAFASEWIFGPGDRAGYVGHLKDRFGQDVLDGIAATAGRTSETQVRYGYAPTLRFRM
jgi:glutaconate CoA-transferase subunit A